MDKEEVAGSVAYCGLVCKLCHLADECDGCKNTASKCANHSQHWEGCFHRKCCIDKNINGCWECDDFPCNKEMFDTDTHDIKVRACVRCIREDGMEKFIDYIIKNERNGIRYSYQKDYDFMKNEEEVLHLLRTGIKR